jgi:hypothetical protein
MAAARIQSFGWNGDASEMAIWTAYAPGQSNAIYVSNHSYGLVGGWIRLFVQHYRTRRMALDRPVGWSQIG